MRQLRTQLDQGQITDEQFLEQISAGSRDIRSQGTGIFISHNNRRYLLTARHVVWDDHTPNPPGLPKEYAFERSQNQIYGIIFRVPSLDEILSMHPADNPKFLMNLGSGAPDLTPYTFSDPSNDLAIISLDQEMRQDAAFADELESRGYTPIPVEKIAEEPGSEGQEVFTVGFPSATSLIGSVGNKLDHWASNYHSLPSFSFGRVSMLHDMLPFFWVDMSIYPGNSGGPVITDGNLVGIVSQQASIPINEASNLTTRIPFGKMIKAKFVLELLDAQEKKDQWFQNHHKKKGSS